MSNRQPSPLTPEQWNEIFQRFNQSQLNQKTFCEREGLAIHQFKYRYQRSEHFVGTRRTHSSKRDTGGAKAAPGSSNSAFRPVRPPIDAPGHDDNAPVCIRLGDRVQMHCPASVGIEALMRLAREGLS